MRKYFFFYSLFILLVFLAQPISKSPKNSKVCADGLNKNTFVVIGKEIIQSLIWLLDCSINVSSRNVNRMSKEKNNFSMKRHKMNPEQPVMTYSYVSQKIYQANTLPVSIFLCYEHKFSLLHSFKSLAVKTIIKTLNEKSKIPWQSVLTCDPHISIIWQSLFLINKHFTWRIVPLYRGCVCSTTFPIWQQKLHYTYNIFNWPPILTCFSFFFKLPWRFTLNKIFSIAMKNYQNYKQ